MNDKKLLLELLAADFEDDAIAALQTRDLLNESNSKRWVALGNMANTNPHNE